MMKLLFCSLLCLSLLTLGCIDQKERPVADSYVDTIATIPDTIVEKSSLQYNHQQSIWTSGDVPFSGYAVQYFPNHQLKEKFAILNGKRQNEMTMWYPDGHLKTVATYDLGKLHGPKRIWSQDSGHVLIALYNYHRGKPHGAQKKWYPNGQLFKKLNLRHGQEEGLQQAFRETGVLYANYEVRNGRAFGLNKSKLCYSLDKEKIKRE